jgi:hypothetical protein
MELPMSTTYMQSVGSETAAYGGLVDAVGGVATVVLAIVALAGVHADILTPIAVIVFGAALLIQGGAMLSEYAQLSLPTQISAEQFGAGSLSSVFLVGAAGIVLGVLALIGIASGTLTSIAVIAFGVALLIGSNSVRHLYLLRSAAMRSLAPQDGAHFLAGEMASGSAGVQLLAGLTGIVLGILAVTGISPEILMLSALIVLGATVVLTGSTMSGIVLGFMPSSETRTNTAVLP